MNFLHKKVLISTHTKGFTLIELLVVISIIGLLSSVVLASLTAVRSKGRDARRLADMRQVQLALEMYRDRLGYYPLSNSSAAGIRYDSCSDGSSSAVPNGNWGAMMNELIAQGFLSSPIRDPINSGYGTPSSYCYQYASPQINSPWYRCRAPNVTNASVFASNYPYVLYLRTENPQSSLWPMVWNSNTPTVDHVTNGNPAYSYCILGN